MKNPLNAFAYRGAILGVALGLGSLLAACSYTNAYEAPAPCNLPATVSYQVHVLPILTKNCYSCHSAKDYQQSTAGTFNMEDFTQVKFYSNPANGRNNVSYMVGNIRHDAGFVPMPNNGDKLSVCDIATIKAWVDAGAPNN
ncbi:MAG TPA: hypothetical protein VFO93_17505 [Hymenobacter sp.]|uniref:hypothetical protein n=1 Tax=Hymenobacter sp. TaxID=1898978 RepID=UPI002D802BAD|nr:hypothetical protein [Hymenobacter sp.]HET9505344.1 hypothetical protein [Hymenobacter sp.]